MTDQASPSSTATPSEDSAKDKPLSTHDFYFETPIYEIIKNDKFEQKDIFSGEIKDAYNPATQKETDFEIYCRDLDYSSNNWLNYYAIHLTCKRDDQIALRFFVYRDSEKTYKCGQDPSLAEIQFSKMGKKYDKLLSKNDLFEFKRAIGLNAHGTGIGSLVYLRRIFENLINEAYTDNAMQHGVDDAFFKKLRMAEKVDALKDYLPSELVEMKSIYSIMSTGVHNLTEQQCLTYFPALKLSIELILDQRIAMKAKQDRDTAVRDEVQRIAQELGTSTVNTSDQPAQTMPE